MATTRDAVAGGWLGKVTGIDLPSVSVGGTDISQFDPTNPNSQVFHPQSWFDVHVRNNTGAPIKVWICFLPYEEPGSSQLAMLEDPWQTDGFVVQPGRTLLVANASGRYAYFFAQSMDGATYWGGSNALPIQGALYNFKQADMGGKFGRYIYTFNP
jgi:hypothetical protein